LTDEIPDDGKEHRVEIIVEDAEGTHTEYVNNHVYGDRIVRNISYKGRAVVKVYVDGELVGERNVE
jgi:serine/threonine-protein kinase